MRGRSRIVVLAGGIVAVLALGALIDLLVADVPAARPPAAVEDPLQTHTAFCPPTLDAGTNRLWAGAGLDENASVAIGGGKPSNVAAGGLASASLGRKPVEVVAYGGRVAAGVATRIGGKASGVGAAACAADASTVWHFAEGDTELGNDERLLVYNPFPEEAVVSVTTSGRDGSKAVSNLADLPVGSGAARILSLNQAVLPQQPLVATTVEAERGRVVAWRLETIRNESRPRGVQFTLGAPRASTRWFFPDGDVAEGNEERLLILNPSDREATVSISLATRKRPLQLPKLSEIVVAPQSARAISISKAAAREKAPDSLGAIVRSTSGVGIVVERTIWYDSAETQGVASEVGATEPSHAWVVGPTVAAPYTDHISILNPGPQAATVDIDLGRRGGTINSPDRLRSIEVPARGRVSVSIVTISSKSATLATVTSDQPIVVERRSYSRLAGEVAASMGVPIELEESVIAES